MKPKGENKLTGWSIKEFERVLEQLKYSDKSNICPVHVGPFDESNEDLVHKGSYHNVMSNELLLPLVHLGIKAP